jgi:putative hemolysin
MLVELLVILGLTLLNGFFAGAELAVLSTRRMRLQELAGQGSGTARAILRLREQPERFLATVQIGITVVGATAAAFGGSSIAVRLVGPLERLGLGASAEEASLALVVGGISFLTLVLGELVPKSLAIRYSERYASLVAHPLRGLSWGLRPLAWLLTASSNLVLRFFKDRTNFTESRMSPEELRQLVEEATREGSVHKGTGEIASRAFALAELRLSDVMVPRTRVVALPRHAPAERVKQVLLEEGHSRMPVYEGTIDRVVGYVVTKDLVGMALESQLVVLEDALRPAFFLPETVNALDALRQMQARRVPMAVVVDEHGSTAGIVTLEELLEELVGELFSEDDVPEQLVERLADGSAVVSGEAPLRDVNRALGLSLPEEEDWTTVGGLCLALAGAIPPAGTKLTAEGGVVLEVLEASAQRVQRVRLLVPPAPAEEEEG